MAMIERLWTPWRMAYVGKDFGEADCVFCNHIASQADAQHYIVQRNDRHVVMFNLFPYNTGHVMQIPHEHVGLPEDLDARTLPDMATALPTIVRALRRAMGCDGFNIGMNVGGDAGAGIADHVHQHIVPRWQGDANFMPVLAATKTLPELIPATYAKLRAELWRETTGIPEARVLLLDEASNVLLHNGAMPTVVADSDEPLWRAVTRTLGKAASTLTLMGWAGESSIVQGAGDSPTIAVGYEFDGALPDGWEKRRLDELQPDDPARVAATRFHDNVGSMD